jgi:phosphoribosylformylglycinamidine synthase
VRRPEEADAAVLQIPEADTAIAVAIDGNGRRVACDPYRGTVEAVLECAQNLACVGAEPLGLTNCLNFGNPEKPAVAWQLDRSTRGLADACEELGVPVVGGNVSLYNETDRGPIYPTPVVGMVGELPVPGELPAAALREGDAIAFAGPIAPDLRGSQLAKLRGELDRGLGGFEIGSVGASIAAVRDAVRDGLLHTAHDVSDGGLACALAESALAGGTGVDVDLGPLLGEGDPEAWLFGEGPGGFVLGGEVTAIERLVEAGTATLVGVASGEEIRIAAGALEVAVPLADAAAAWQSLGAAMEAAPA